MKKVLIKPVEGRRVIIPLRNKLLTEQMLVNLDKFWSRRLKQGDVELVIKKKVNRKPKVDKEER